MSINLVSINQAKSGFLTEVFDTIAKFRDSYKNCNLVLDSIAIRKELLWNSSSNIFVSCDYGNDLALEDPDVLATDLLAFLFVELSSK